LAPKMDAVDQIFSDDASVKFHSLQVRGEKRFASGLMFQGNFT